MAGRGASLKPSDMLAGGRVPDGRYTVKSSTAELFDYGGKSNEIPAACLVFRSASDGTEHEQYYSAGDVEYLIPSEDKDEFVHPRGEEAKFSQNTNFGKFIKSLLGAGFPEAELTNKMSCLRDIDVELVGQAQPKNQSGKETVLSLPTKYYGRGGKGKAPVARPTGKPTAVATPSKAATPVAASNGDVDEQAREQVLSALAANEGTLTRQRLGTIVITAVAALKKERPEVFANLVAIQRVTKDAGWLAAQAEAGGWSVKGDEISLG